MAICLGGVITLPNGYCSAPVEQSFGESVLKGRPIYKVIQKRVESMSNGEIMEKYVSEENRIELEEKMRKIWTPSVDSNDAGANGGNDLVKMSGPGTSGSLKGLGEKRAMARAIILGAAAHAVLNEILGEMENQKGLKIRGLETELRKEIEMFERGTRIAIERLHQEFEQTECSTENTYRQKLSGLVAHMDQLNKQSSDMMMEREDGRVQLMARVEEMRRGVEGRRQKIMEQCERDIKEKRESLKLREAASREDEIWIHHSKVTMRQEGIRCKVKKRERRYIIEHGRSANNEEVAEFKEAAAKKVDLKRKLWESKVKANADAVNRDLRNLDEECRGVIERAELSMPSVSRASEYMIRRYEETVERKNEKEWLRLRNECSMNSDEVNSTKEEMMRWREGAGERRHAMELAEREVEGKYRDAIERLRREFEEKCREIEEEHGRTIDTLMGV